MKHALTEICVNVIRMQGHVLVAACDSSILGKKLKHGKLTLEITPKFYDGARVKLDEAVRLLREATTANLIGTIIVERAVKEGLVHPQAVILISGVPHAQIMRL